MSRKLLALSPRERQVVRRLAEGQTVREIALDLACPPRPWSFTASALRHKIGSPSIALLTRYAIREGISEL